MQVKVIGKSGKKGAEIAVPDIFSEPYRPDIIKKAVLAAQANRLQPYGPDRTAGTLSSGQSPAEPGGRSD
jgi:large subunit ribosomal protein L4e